MTFLIASWPTSLPVTDPVLIFAIVMLILLIAPLLIKLLRVPAMIGLIAAGTVIGPNVLGVLDRDPTIVLLGTVGLLYIMFLAGLEIDLNEFAKAKGQSAVFGVFTFILPQSAGTGLGILLGYPLPAAILLGSLFASHTLLAYPIASQLKIHKNESSTMAVGGTIITDFAALLVLAIIAGSAKGELNQEFWITLGTSLVIYTVVVLVGLPRLGRWFFSKVDPEATAEYIFVLAALFVCAFFAEVAGVEAIIGAFLAGLTLNRLIPESSTLMNRINFVGNALFIPFFLLSVGMLVDPMVLIGSMDAWIVAGSMTATVIITKFSAAMLSRLFFGFNHNEGMVVFGLTIPQAAATLAAVMVGFQLKLFDEATVNGVIVMILCTCIIGPAVVQKWGARVAQEMANSPEENTQPQRIMIPMLTENPDNTLEFLFALRGHNKESVYPVAVVDEDSPDSVTDVARAERQLEHALHYMAGADVSAIPMTRVASNTSTGIKRAALERRISHVVIPWDGKLSEGRIFGRRIDPLLDDLSAQLFIARIVHPINTTKRIVAVIAEGVELEPGFEGTVHDIKKVAGQLGAMITVISTHSQLDVIESMFQTIGPSVTVSCVGFDDFKLMLSAAGERADANDLTVIALPRPGNAAWAQEYTTIPHRMHDLIGGSYVFIFPSEIAQAKQETVQIADVLANVRFHLGLQEPSVDDMIRHILDAEFHLDHELPRRIARIIGESGTFQPVGDRGLLISAHSPDFPCDVLIVATSDVPVQLSPRDTSDTRFVGLLLSCKARTQREHLQHQQEMVVALNHLQNVPGILTVYSAKEFIRRGTES